ncbi:cytochrome c [Phenylobacterium sp.]|uniref:c-type cytochrome n=1 Tax=Phenylobacterium sp. TaxID=1871053 RepID=UPI0035AE3B5D
MRRTLLIAALSALVAACATGSGPGRAPASAAERGAQFAWRACNGCHAVGPEGGARNGAAPAFRDLRLRFTSLQLERRLAEISRNGHYEMPPVFISREEAADIAAYVESLGG